MTTTASGTAMAAGRTTKKTRHHGYRPMAPQALTARLAFLAQAERHSASPQTPVPDAELLALLPHGPFKTIRVGSDPKTCRPAIFFTLQNPDRGERWCPPEAFLMLDLLLAFGGGCSVNANVGGEDGWAYVRPWGGNYRHTLGRLVTNAGPGEVAKQSLKADHHDQSPRNFRRTGGVGGKTSPALNKSKARRSSYKGREEAIATALRYYRANHSRSGTTLTLPQYRQVLGRAFRLLDAVHGIPTREAV